MASFTLSDTVIIVICGAGVVLIISVVMCLIWCITSKKKDNVRVIHLSNRPRPERRRETRPRREEMPKPPPYSELPPEYSEVPRQTHHNIHVHRETTETRPATTRAVNVSLHRTSSIRTRHGSPHPTASARGRAPIERDGTPHQYSHRNNNSDHRRGAGTSNNIRANVTHISNTNEPHPSSFRHQANEPQQPTINHTQALITNPVQSSSSAFQNRNRHATNPPSNLLPGEVGSGVSPPPMTTPGEIRRAQRQHAIVTVQNSRMQRMTVSPPPAYDHILAI